MAAAANQVKNMASSTLAAGVSHQAQSPEASNDAKRMKQQVRNVLSETALHVLDNGGVVRSIESLGSKKPLPYKMKKHQEIHTHGNYYAIQFDASPSTMQSLHRSLGLNETVIRRSLIKIGDSLPKILPRKTGVFTPEFK